MEPSNLRLINEANAEKALSDERHQDLLISSTQVQDTILSAVSSLITYLEGHITKTQVINQLESIETPDVKYVVEALQLVDKSVRDNKPDNSELVALMQSMVKELSTLPREVPTFEQKDSVSVSNLATLEKGIESLQKAVNGLDLSVEAPDVHVEAPDLTSIKDAMGKVEKAIKAIPKPTEPEKVFSGIVDLVDGSVPIVQSNLIIEEKYDDFKIDYDDEMDEDNETVVGVRYYYNKKKVAELRFEYNQNGNIRRGYKV